jgi:hypothetical protein
MIFYIRLKNFIKNKLTRINQLDDLQLLIKLIIKINNHNYERQLKKDQDRT